MELMVVVIVIGVIAGFAIPSFQKANQKGRERIMFTVLHGFKGAIEIYKARHGHYLIHDFDYSSAWLWSSTGSGDLEDQLGIQPVSIDSDISLHYRSNTDGTQFVVHIWDWESGCELELDQSLKDPCRRFGTCLAYPNCIGPQSLP